MECKSDKAAWPVPLRRAVDAIATLFMQAYMLARERAAGSPSPTVCALAARDEDAYELALLRREMEVFRRRLESMPALKRPQMPPHGRFEVLQLIRLRGLSIEDAAKRYVLHPNTIRDWQKRFLKRGEVGLFFGRAPFNRIGDSVRWLVHQIRELCPEPEFGTRSIAMAIVRAGVRISRRSVQRILRKAKPKAPGARRESDSKPGADAVPARVLRPRKPNDVWHMDLVTLDFLWLRFYVAAVLDGFTRRLLALRVYRGYPTGAEMTALVRRCITAFGKPGFLVTDHGSQFRKQFKRAVERFGIRHVRGRRGNPRANSRVERLFRTLRWWERLTLFAWKEKWIQRRLDVFRDWYNTARPMDVLDARTPEERWEGRSEPDPIPIRTHDPQPAIRIARHGFRGDHRLIVLEIQAGRSLKRSA